MILSSSPWASPTLSSSSSSSSPAWLSLSVVVVVSSLVSLASPASSPNAVKNVCREVQALGVQNGSIPDSAMTATSHANSQRKASDARLYGKNAWTSNDNNFFQYLEIKLGGPRYITHILTQGRDRGNEWVQEYRVEYSGKFFFLLW